VSPLPGFLTLVYEENIPGIIRFPDNDFLWKIWAFRI
jgi:hypothetical protein